MNMTRRAANQTSALEHPIGMRGLILSLLALLAVEIEVAHLVIGPQSYGSLYVAISVLVAVNGSFGWLCTAMILKDARR
jgi:hypothetical protein